MKSALTTLLIIGFVSVAVFGFIGIGHISEAAHYGCLAALSQNGICPSTSATPLAAAFSHLNILRSFSSALLTSAALLLALAGAVLFGIGNQVILSSTQGIQELFLYAHRISFIGNDFFSSNLNWLSLHLNSPSYAMSA